MLRGMRNRSSSRRSPVVSSSDEEEYVTCSKPSQQPPGLVKEEDVYSSNHKYSEPTRDVTKSKSMDSLSSSSEGSMFSSESPSLDDSDLDKLAHESYLNGTIPDLEDILRSFGSKSRKTNSRSGRYENKNNKSKSIVNAPVVLDTYDLGDDEEDRNSNNSSYNSGFSSSSDSSYESIPDTTQIAAFYNSVGDSSPLKSSAVSLSPTSTTTEIHQYNGGWNEESVPHKARPSSRIKSKRRRSERRKQSRLSKMNHSSKAAKDTRECDASFNNDDNRSRQSFLSRTNSLINTSKSFGKNWTRKKRMDQSAASLSDSETKEKLFSVEPVHHRKSESPIATASLITVQDVTSVLSTPTNTKPIFVTSNNTASRVLIAKSKLSHVIERFDCDTGELITDIVVDNGTADRHSKRSSSPTSSPGSSEGRNVDPLALSDVKLNQELSDNESPQKSCGSSGDHVVSKSISSATNVIENMVLLFAKSDVEGIRRLLGESLESSVSSLSTNSSMLSRTIPLDSSNDDGIDIEDDGSDDKGGSDKQKAKHLRQSKLLSLTGAYKQSSKSLQAPFTTNDYTLPLSMRGIVTHYSISILLVEPIHKVFEIVMVDVTRNMSLKETLINACTAAADPILAEQTYISLCSDIKVLSSMSSPVSKLIQKPSDFSKKENVRSNNNQLPDSEKQKEALMRREMERQLLVAVPLKSNFKECQMIRRILWKNTKLQLWWTSYQMKNEHFVTPWSTAPVSSRSQKMPLPQPIAI